ncbi:MAG: hypothetical protein ACLFR7_09830, partial [Opitutales bacterium]
MRNPSRLSAPRATRWAYLGLCWALFAGHGAAAEAGSIGEARAARAELGAFEGTFAVAYADRGWRVGWLADTTGRAAYVHLQSEAGPLRPGEVRRVRFPGDSGAPLEESAGTFEAGEVAFAEFPPRRFRSRAEDLEPGAHFHLFEGWVNRVRSESPGLLGLEIAIDGRAWRAHLPRPEGREMPDYAGKRIRFAAVYSDDAAGTETHFPGNLFVSPAFPIEILGELSTDVAFEAAPLRLAELSEEALGEEVLVEALLSSQRPGYSL